MKSNASFDSNLIPFILNHLCIALTQVSRYCESRHFLSVLLRFSGESIFIPFIRLGIFEDVSGATIPIIVSHCCCSSVLFQYVHFLILLILLDLCILLWLWIENRLLELWLLELLLCPLLSLPSAIVACPKGRVRLSSSSPLFVLIRLEVCSMMSSSGTIPVWDSVLTSGAELCLVGVLGMSLLSCSFGRLAIGGSSNYPPMIGKLRCWPHSIKDIISSCSFRTQ